LLKAHVEASTEFSILLSGILVKIGIYCIIFVLTTSNIELLSSLLLFATSIAIIDTSFRLFFQQDLKRIIALMTVFEMN